MFVKPPPHGALGDGDVLLSVCLSVCSFIRLSSVAAERPPPRLSHIFPPRENLTPRPPPDENYASSGGLLMAPTNTPHLFQNVLNGA